MILYLCVCVGEEKKKERERDTLYTMSHVSFPRKVGIGVILNTFVYFPIDKTLWD